VNLQLGAHQVRVVCPRRMARRLASVLREHLIDEEVPIGFVVRPTTLRTREYVLVDRCGFILASSRGAEHVLASLTSHLTALLPTAEDRVRFRLRTIIREGRATLGPFPLLSIPALEEASLSGSGHTVLDALAVDVGVTDGTIAGSVDRWHGLESLAPPPAHRSALGVAPMPVDRIALALPEGSLPPTEAGVVVALCREALGGERADILAAATTVVAAAETVAVNVRQPIFDQLRG